MRQADTDGDNKVTFDEMNAVISEMTKEQFDERDLNDDGFLTSEEFRPERGQGGP
jgi:hypothetical protein